MQANILQCPRHKRTSTICGALRIPLVLLAAAQKSIARVMQVMWDPMGAYVRHVSVESTRQTTLAKTVGRMPPQSPAATGFQTASVTLGTPGVTVLAAQRVLRAHIRM